MQAMLQKRPSVASAENAKIVFAGSLYHISYGIPRKKA
jgi:hypothetical protein